MTPEEMDSEQPNSAQSSPAESGPRPLARSSSDQVHSNQEHSGRLVDEPGDAQQQQPLSTIKPVYLLTGVMVILIIAAVLITIAIVKA